jgi:hypothetical protein
MSEEAKVSGSSLMDLDLPAIGDALAGTFSDILGRPVGVLIHTFDPRNGDVLGTTNLEASTVQDVLDMLAQKHRDLAQKHRDGTATVDEEATDAN